MAEPKKILMIDDDVNLVNVFRLVFEKVGYVFRDAACTKSGVLQVFEEVLADEAGRAGQDEGVGWHAQRHRTVLAIAQVGCASNWAASYQ